MQPGIPPPGCARCLANAGQCWISTTATLSRKSRHFLLGMAQTVKEKRDPLFALTSPRSRDDARERSRELVASDSIEGFSKLPKAGRNALYITSDGEVKYGVELQAKTSKSLDFRWNTGTTTCYAMHKYTREVGGNQDSQFKEMRELLQQFMRCPDETCILLIIVDERADLRFTRSHPPVHIQDVPEGGSTVSRSRYAARQRPAA